MRSSTASLSKKFTSIFFAAILAFGLMPSAAFAASDDLQSIPEGSEDAVSIASSAEGDSDDVFSHYPSDDAPSADGGGAITSSEDVSNIDNADDAIIPANDIINETRVLQVVAQKESTESYFLAQTLESTRTVPMVSAQLPIDTGTVSEPATPTEGNESECEDDEDSDEISPVGATAVESTVLGSFEYRGITYAIEFGGDSVAVVATDYLKLPVEFIEAQTIVLPNVATPDGTDYYSVIRIADGAFAAPDKKDIAKHMPADIFSAEVRLNSNFEEEGAEASDADIQNTAHFAGGSPSNAIEGIDEPFVGITAIAVPESVTSIEHDAFTGFDALERIVVSPDTPDCASYDGCLYTSDFTDLLTIPSGHQGRVYVHPDTVSIDPDVLLQCASVTELAVVSDSSLLIFEDTFYNATRDAVEIVLADSEPSFGMFRADYADLTQKVATAAESLVAKTETSITVTDDSMIAIDGVQSNTYVESAETYAAATRPSFTTYWVNPSATQTLRTFCYVTSTSSYQYDQVLSGSLSIDQGNAQMNLAGEVVRLYHDNNRMILENQSGGFNAWGLSAAGGVRAIEYAFSVDASESSRMNLPSGSDGISFSRPVYVWFISSATTTSFTAKCEGPTDARLTGYVNETQSSKCTYAEVRSGLLQDQPEWGLASSCSATDVVRLFHDNDRLIIQNGAGFYNAWGLTASGGISAIEYAYSSTASVDERMNVPTGSEGIAFTRSIYVWLQSSAGSTGFRVACEGPSTGSMYGFVINTQGSTQTYESTRQGTLSLNFGNPSVQDAFSIKRLYHDNNRLILQNSAGFFNAWGLASDGGVSAIEYAFTADAPASMRRSVPSGAGGIAFSRPVYVWLIAGYDTGFSIRWDANGGAFSDGSSLKQLKYHTGGGNNLKGPRDAIPVRSGYGFVGWATSASATSGSMTVSATTDATFYAVWKPVYTITLNGNSATSAGTTKVYYRSGTAGLWADAACLTALTASNWTKPSRTNYLFNGYWTSAALNSGTQYLKPDGSVTNVGTSTWSANVTLYAQWIPVSTVKLMKNDGTDGVFKTLYYKWGQAGKLYTDITCTTEQGAGSALKAGRTGYAFGGFSSSVSGGTSYIGSDGSYDSTSLSASAFGSATAPNSSAQIYAQWSKREGSIILEIASSDAAAGAKFTQAQVDAYNAASTSPKAAFKSATRLELVYDVNTSAFSMKDANLIPALLGSTFDGWDPGIESFVVGVTSVWNTASETYPQRTYTAKWKTNSYAITYEYVSDGGKTLTGAIVKNGILPSSFNEATTVRALPEMQLRGYVWTGWTRKDTGASVTEIPNVSKAMIFVGHFDRVSYTIEVDLDDATENSWHDGSFDMTYDEKTLELPSNDANELKKAGYVFKHFEAYKKVGTDFEGPAMVYEDGDSTKSATRLLPGHTYQLLDLGSGTDVYDVAKLVAVWEVRIAIDVPESVAVGILADVADNSLKFRAGETKFDGDTDNAYAPLKFVSYTTAPVGIVEVADDTTDANAMARADLLQQAFRGKHDIIRMSLSSTETLEHMIPFAGKTSLPEESTYLNGLRLEAADADANEPYETEFYLGMYFGSGEARLKAADLSPQLAGSIAKLYYTVTLLKDEVPLEGSSTELGAYDDEGIIW